MNAPIAVIVAWALACTTSAAGLYSVELVAPPTAHTAIDFRLSSNERGQVAFAGTDAVDGLSKLFLWNCVADLIGPCSVPTAVSFFGAGRDFSGAALSSATIPEVVSRDRVSGSPSRQFVRKWNQGAFVELGDSGSPDLTFGVATGYLSINKAGNVVAATANLSFNPQIQYFVGNNAPGNTVAEGAALTIPLSAAAIARPQLAQLTNQFVTKFLAGADSGTAADEIAVVTSSGTRTLVTRNQQTNVNPFTGLGDVPGISENGDVVAFVGTRAHPTLLTQKRGIHVWVKTKNQSTVFPVVWEGSDGVSSLAGSLSNRVAVIARKGATGKDPVTMKPRYFQLVTVGFLADAPVSGVYSVDLLFEVFENYIPLSDPVVDYVKLVAVSKMTAIAKVGDLVGSSTLTGNFATWGPFMMLRGGDLGRTEDDTLRPVIAFSAEIAGSKRVVMRAIRNCAVDSPVPLPIYKQFRGKRDFPDDPAHTPPELGEWAGIPLATSPAGNNIGAVGCTLTSATNVLNYFLQSAALDPLLANNIFSNKPFLIQNNVPVEQPTHTAMTKRLPALAKGNLNIDIAARLMPLYGQTLGYLQLDEFVFPKAPVPLPSSDVKISATVAEEPLSTVVDFFLCNGEPVIVKVFNCKGDSSSGPFACTGHYLVVKDKKIFANAANGSGLGASSHGIDDPGSGFATELLNKFPAPGGKTGYRANKIAGVRALTRQRVAGMEKVGNKLTGRLLSIAVYSPVDLRITDPLGRVVDLLASGTGLNQIPNAYFSDETFSDFDQTVVASEARKVIIAGPENALGYIEGQGDGLVDGGYTVDIMGTGSGAFLIRIDSQESDGNVRTRTVRGMAAPGYTDKITFTISTTPGQMFKLARASLSSPARGDVDLSGTVDALDLNEIQQLVGANSDGPGDPRDVDGDGTITQQDVAAAQPLVTASLDIDLSIAATKYDALTDGLIAIRYLFGLTSSSLTNGALGATATRTDPAAIKTYMDANRAAFDIDGDGNADALTDGLLIIRYLFGLRGDALINGAIAPLATRKTAAAVEEYLVKLTP